MWFAIGAVPFWRPCSPPPPLPPGGLEKTGRIGRIAIDPRNPERARGYVQIMTVKEPEEARPEEPAADPDE